MGVGKRIIDALVTGAEEGAGRVGRQRARAAARAVEEEAVPLLPTLAAKPLPRTPPSLAAKPLPRTPPSLAAKATKVTTKPAQRRVAATVRAARPEGQQSLIKDFGEAKVMHALELDPKASPEELRSSLINLEGRDLPNYKFSIGARTIQPSKLIDIDPRIMKRKSDDPLLNDLTVGLSAKRFDEPKPISIYDLHGRPFVTSMSDLAAGGDDITHINGMELPWHVQRRGGQDYMFDPLNPGAVWANTKGVVNRHLQIARELEDRYGQQPLFLPWAMGPNAIDFAQQPRELQLAYAAGKFGKRDRNKLTSSLQDILPDFRSLDDPESIEMFRQAAGKQRGALNTTLDALWKDHQGLGIGEGRLANIDLEQMGMPLADLRNVGQIDTQGKAFASTHPAFPYALPGQGLGRLKEPVAGLSLLPDLMREKGITDPRVFPMGVVEGVPSPYRSMQMNPYGGVINDEILEAIRKRGYAEGGLV